MQTVILPVCGRGDIFSYSNKDGSVLIAKVKSISIDGTTVTITEDADIQLDNVFDYVKVEGGVKNPTQQEAEQHSGGIRDSVFDKQEF